MFQCKYYAKNLKFIMSIYKLSCLLSRNLQDNDYFSLAIKISNANCGEITFVLKSFKCLLSITSRFYIEREQYLVD